MLFTLSMSKPKPVIWIDHFEFTQARQAFRQWLDLYDDQLEPGSKFTLYPTTPGTACLEGPEDLPFDLFCYLVNYLRYPNDLPGNPDIRGYTLGAEDPLLQDQFFMIYVPAEDEYYDIVHLTNPKNQSYCYDFGGKVTEVAVSRNFEPLPEWEKGAPESFRVAHRERTDKKHQVKEGKTGKRLGWLAGLLTAVSLGAFVLAHTVADLSLLAKVHYWTAFGVCGWFFIDYQLLQKRTHYAICLLMAALWMAWTGWLIRQTILDSSDLILATGIGPMVFLVVQGILRHLFMLIFRREPTTERDGNVADMIYTFILIGTLFSSLWIASQLNHLLR